MSPWPHAIEPVWLTGVQAVPRLPGPPGRVSLSGDPQAPDRGGARGVAGPGTWCTGLRRLDRVLDAPVRAYAGCADRRRLLGSPRRGATGQGRATNVAARLCRNRRSRTESHRPRLVRLPGSHPVRGMADTATLAPPLQVPSDQRRPAIHGRPATAALPAASRHLRLTPSVSTTRIQGCLGHVRLSW
jgi:hypothetical protein